MSSAVKLPPRNALAVLHDMVLGAVSFLLALYLRLGDATVTFAAPYIWEGACGFAFLLLVTLLYYRTYRRVWLYTSLNDLMSLAKAGTLALLVFYVGMFAVNRLEGLPRSVPLIHWMCLMLCLSTPRVVWRVLHDRALLRRLLKGGYARVPVLLIGAGEQAEMFIRESERRKDFPYFVAGLVDDDPRQHGREIHHARIYGSLAETDFIVRKLIRKGRGVHRLLVTDPNLPPATFQQLLAVASEHHLSLARLPSLTELKAGEGVQDLHPIAVEDILGRPQVALDRELMRSFVTGKRVLVTGAGGSIGAELVRQLAQHAPKELLLYELNESSLYYIDHELAEASDVARQAVIGDVRDEKQLERCFAGFKPEIVFHAAAIKHVPLAEANPEIAVMTNIGGSKLVADQCAKHGVAAMVQISTDKAVNPASVMGASKRVAELYAASLAEAGSTRFITVRFGNVLNSAGSVMPLFQKQIAAGGPITVTHRDMTRYFMTISEAVQLVLQAAALGAKGPQHAPIFVLDMGEPVRIEELAKQMIRLAGLTPEKDIKIVFTGARPGEKLTEELFHAHEDLVATAHPGIRLAGCKTPDARELRHGIEAVVEAARAGNGKAIPLLLKQIVAEYDYLQKERA